MLIQKLKENKLLLALVFVLIFLLALAPILYYLNIKPVTKNYSNSTSYYKDILGNILFRDTSGCFGSCLFVTYKFSPIDKNSFKIFYIKSDMKYFKDEILESCYARDKNHIYYNEKPLDIVDIESFDVIDECLGKDKKSFYIGDSTLQSYLRGLNQNIALKNNSADLISFKHMGYMVVKSGNEYFYVDIDANTIAPISAKDAVNYPSLMDRSVENLDSGNVALEIENPRPTPSNVEAEYLKENTTPFTLGEYENCVVHPRYNMNVLNRKDALRDKTSVTCDYNNREVTLFEVTDNPKFPDAKNSIYRVWKDNEGYKSLLVDQNGAGSGEGVGKIILVTNNGYELLKCFYFKSPENYDLTYNKEIADKDFDFINDPKITSQIENSTNCENFTFKEYLD